MSLTTLLRPIALLTTFFITLPVYAQQEDADGAPAVWQETAVKLPAAPAKAPSSEPLPLAGSEPVYNGEEIIPLESK